MMPALGFVITSAGLDALVDAQNAVTGPIVVTEMGITETAFVMAPTLTALPGEVRRLDTVAGVGVDAFTIHVTARDLAAVAYTVTGLGLFLDDGTLFAVWSAPSAETPLCVKSADIGFFALFDCRFTSNVATSITFGDADFTYPPATETMMGVAERATVVEALARADTERFLTPATLDAVLDVVQGFTVTGTGIATGGGDGTAHRQINVPGATPAELLALVAGDKAVTPNAMGQALVFTGTATAGTINILGRFIIKWVKGAVTANAANSFTFNTSFPTACFGVVPSGWAGTDPDQKDNAVLVDPASVTASGFSTFNAYSSGADAFFIAIGN